LLVTNLVIHHHLSDRASLDSALVAAWDDAAGVSVADVHLLGGGPRHQDAALVLVDHVASDDEAELVAAAVLDLAQRVPTLVLGAALTMLPAVAEASGVDHGEWTPRHEVRVRPEPGVDPRRLGDLLLAERLLIAEKIADDVVTLATANVAYVEHPAVTWRQSSGLAALLVDGAPDTWQDRELLRFVGHVLGVVGGRRDAGDVRVGVIGYGAIGHEHALAVRAVPGLALAAVSDLSPARVDVARSVSTDVRGYTDSDDLLADAEVDLVVVSTPPNTHGYWAKRALDAGKHVVLEKPMALSTLECDEVIEQAARADRLVVVYQNRRFDPDYLAMRRLVRAGAVGQLFHVESFVGGFGHPCNYWHSDAAVSGGAIFDWGSHYIDQLLDLMPGEIAHVVAANHKRVWHDVTNADHSRVTIQFADGRQADFIHSDLAAAPKPKWWALGTAGAIRGDWRQEKVVARSAIGTLDEDLLALADSPACMTLHSADGSVTELAAPPAPAHTFHRELADYLHRGLPMSVTAGQSRRVVAVMEAAERSAATGSMPTELA
jgi:scyllo-inositol 2-dehydrogenase (NADP+)